MCSSEHLYYLLWVTVVLPVLLFLSHISWTQED